jgi:hypothetical protein
METASMDPLGPSPSPVRSPSSPRVRVLLTDLNIGLLRQNALRSYVSRQTRPMNGVIEVLEFLGYEEIRLQDESWQLLSEMNGALGTTDETYVIQEDERPRIRLRDPETGEEIGRARRESPPTDEEESQ